MTDIATPPTAVSPDAFSARLYDHDAGKYIDVPANQVDQHIASGKFTFPQGVEIPVVAPDGTQGSIPAEHAYDAFTNHGMSWLTPQAQQAGEARDQQQVISKNFSNQPLTAAALGVARMGSLGLSDVALKEGGLGDAAKAVGDQNQLATGVGEVAGALLPDSLAATAAKGLGKLAGGAVVKGAQALGETGAIATKVLPQVAKEAAAGAVFGAGSGVSEQALGHPDDVTDNLVSHIGMGALFGGTLGGVFGGAEVARPALDGLVEKAVEGGRSQVDKLASQAMSKNVVAALSKAGAEDAARELGSAMSDQEFQRVYQEFGPNAAKDMLAEQKGTLKATKDQLKGIQSEFHGALQDASDGVRQDVTDTMKRAGGDVVKASEDSYQAYRAAADNFETLTSGLKDPLTYDSKPLIDRFESAVDKLNDGSAYAKNISKKIEARLSTADFEGQGSEASFFADIRSQLNNVSHDGMSAAESKIVRSLVDEADQSLLTSPNLAIRHSYESLKAAEETAQTMRNVGDRVAFRITKSPLPGEQVADAGYAGAPRVVDQQKMLRTLSDPQTRMLVNGVFQNLDALSPEIKALGQGVKSVEEKIALQNQLEMKLAKILPRGAHVDGAAVTDVLDLLGNPKHLAAKFDRLQELQQTLGQDASPLQRIIASKQALGQPIGDDLMRIASQERRFDLLQKYKDVQTSGFDPISAVKGMAIGGPKGALWGLKSSTVGEQFDVLASLQRSAQRGADKMEKAIKTTVSVLTSAPAKQLARGAVYASGENHGPSMAEKRKTYQQTAAALSNYQPRPSPLQSYAPKIASAVDAKQKQIALFLQSKMPEDPFKEDSISISKTGYVPSDHDLSSFYRYVQAANNPMQVLESIKQNKASPEEIETLKTIYPSVYQKLQNAVLDGIISSKADLTYQQKIQLGTVFDIPTDYTLRPDFISRMQQSIGADPGGRPSGPTNKRTIKLDLKPEESVATQAQRTTYDMNH